MNMILRPSQSQTRCSLQYSPSNTCARHHLSKSRTCCLRAGPSPRLVKLTIISLLVSSAIVTSYAFSLSPNTKSNNNVLTKICTRTARNNYTTLSRFGFGFREAGNGKSAILSSLPLRMVVSRPNIEDQVKKPSNTKPKTIQKEDQPNNNARARATSSSTGKNKNNDNEKPFKRRRKKYKRKRPKTQSEQDVERLRRKRQAEYERVMQKSESNIWDFESLFPTAVWDEETIHRDLYEVAERDRKKKKEWQKQQQQSYQRKSKTGDEISVRIGGRIDPTPDTIVTRELAKRRNTIQPEDPSILMKKNATGSNSTDAASKVDISLTRMVEDRVYGFRRSQRGDFEYETSLMGDGAVKFRDGKRLGKALTVNTDRLNHFARKELAHGRLEEAEELYELAAKIDPRDGRAYLGLSRIAQRRRDFRYAKKCLQSGIANSVSTPRIDPKSGLTQDYDKGANPFLLQALGCLEERMGHLAEAERLFVAATKSRSAHAASWVSLAQLRTRKLRQGPNAGRVCYQTAEAELKQAGLPPSSHVYTAWAALEWKAGNIRKARELFKMALEIDPKCSAAWLQFGVMESEQTNWTKAKDCFETVLKFDQRNSRVLQAYAIMESKRPDGDSREVIELFERALKVKPRDGGVLQAYGLYVAELGDINAARELLRRGTTIDKRHAPLWQAWGVLETREGKAEDAREIFQQGIWACAQASGGQSGGRRCARLWQAWGVLEAQEEDFPAARRCFSRALDADSRNVAAVTAWTLMEEKLGNYNDARLIFERVIKQFSSPSDEKVALWRAYELMETEAGNLEKAQSVYNRSIRDSMAMKDYITANNYDDSTTKPNYGQRRTTTIEAKDNSKEVEVSRWKSRDTFGESSVWMNDGSIEGKVPASAMKKRSQRKQS